MTNNPLQESLLAAQALANAMKRYMNAEDTLDLRDPTTLLELEDAAYDVGDCTRKYRLSL